MKKPGAIPAVVPFAEGELQLCAFYGYITVFVQAFHSPAVCNASEEMIAGYRIRCACFHGPGTMNKTIGFFVQRVDGKTVHIPFFHSGLFIIDDITAVSNVNRPDHPPVLFYEHLQAFAGGLCSCNGRHKKDKV